MKLRATRKPASVQFSMACATIGITRLSMAVGLATLTPIRGTGIWSAQTFLIHALAGAAALAAADRGILRAAAGRCRFNAPPMPGPVVVRSAAWRPYPSYAAAMLWRPPIPGGKESDPKARGLLAQASHRAAEQEPT
jgi:DNA-3-methyladenine glycosylase II